MAARSKCVLVLSFLNAVVFTTQKSIHANTRIHHHMNVDDLREVFQVERHSDVPDYEIVHFHSIRKREASSPPEAAPSPSFAATAAAADDNRVEEDNNNENGSELAERLLKLEAFGRSHELSLQPLDQQLFKGNLKMWSAESDGNGSISYTELPDTYVGDPYQDEENQAALLLHEDRNDGSLLMEGTIGHDLVIKPLPAHLRKQMERMQTKVDKKKMTDELEGSNTDGDEMFMDREMKLGQDQIAKNGFPLGKEEKEDGNRNNNNNNNGNNRNNNKDDDEQNETTFHPHHVVFRRQSHVNDDLKFSDFAYMEAGDFYKNKAIKKRRKRSIVKREAPYIIYPEILVIVDYDGYRLHGGDNVQVKRYFVSFWNGVDLRYKLLKGPKVRISIAGLIISRGRDATPYLERNRVGRDAVDSAAALTDMGKYLFRERRLPVYDIAVAVTKLDMCRRHYANDACNRGTAGFAYVGGACVVNKRLEKVNSVAIIEDTGGFSGIIVAAHEVGHLLGAVHDGSPPPTYLGGPGAEKCRWEDGFIMSDLRHSEKGFKWSACSVSSFHHFLNGDTATCLYNSPHEDESLPRVLPGKLLTLDAQCRRDRGTSACFKDERVCSQLFCFDSGSGYCVAYRPAAEGSPCGDGQTCSNGICIAEHENIIPDYSQNTPAYLRRSDEDLYARALYSNSTKRSEWEEFWRTATVRTPSLAVGSYPAHNHNNNNNGYEQQPPSSTPSYNAYQSIFQSLGQQQQPQQPLKSGLDQFALYTTKGAFNETPRKSHKVASKAYSTYAKKSNKSPPSPSPSLPSAYRGDVSTTRYRFNDFLYTPYAKSYQPAAENDECVDKAFELPGAVSCYDYLTKYGLRYCADEYFKRNCCAAIKYVCNNYQPL